MTPCEKLGHKVGDAFIAPFAQGKIKKGDIIYLAHDDDSRCPYFTLEESLNGKKHCFYISSSNEEDNVKPYKPQTEAERRGAKFGVGGFIKDTGEKIVFHRCNNNKWYYISERYNCIMWTRPDQIRLDHEPEYKLIPFSEATHEHRMCVENLVYGNGNTSVSQIIQFNNGAYGITIFGSKTILTHCQLFKVKVPA